MSVFVPACILIPVIGGILLYRYFSAVEKLILLYLFVSGICNATVSILANTSTNNLPLLHVYTVVEYCLAALFFIKLFQSPRIIKGIYFFSALFIFFAVLNTLFIQHLYSFNTYARSVEAILIISYCFIYFMQQLKTDQQPGTVKGIWFVSGWFLYFSSSLTIFILSNISLTLSKQFDWWMWNVHATMVLIMYLLFTKGFITCKK